MEGATRLTKDQSKLTMTNTIRPFNVAKLTVALPEYNLRRGQVGTVVDILAEGNAFEVEFCDREGRIFESLGLRAEQIMALRHELRRSAM